MLIGAQGYQTDTPNSGAGFLFDTNGGLLTTLTNPIPGDHLFGHSVTALGGDKLVVGAPQSDPTTLNPGHAYLFSTNGTLLMTLASPAPVSFDNFGWSVTAMGLDRVLVGALSDNAGLGAAYLFSTDGSLLKKFSSPTPDLSAGFGSSLTMVGADRVLIGSPNDGAWTRAGAAYLFSTNGNPLISFTNPMALPVPNQYLEFGSALASLGNTAVVIGSPAQETGAVKTGAAFLLAIPPPSLRICHTSTNLSISWSMASPNFDLQENTSGLGTPNWSTATGTIQDDGTNFTLTVSPSMGNRFYRLLKR